LAKETLMLLKEILTPDVVCCGPGTSALAAARLMRERHVGDVVVVNDGDDDQTPLGVVTDRDLVVEVLGRERDPSTMTVRDIMRTPVAIAHTSEDAREALERMKRHGVRRIPVMGDHQKLAGILCLDDLLRQLAADATALTEVVFREQDCEHRLRR
jgi:CBS domain-containing protein